MSAPLARQELDSLALPLRGMQLIEASAGTGKTFTIAMLYLRLVLGHDSNQGDCRGRSYSPAELLVLTFTEAAAGELRDRIRARLSEAALAFSAGQSKDVALQKLIADYSTSDHAIAAQRLRDAEQTLDEAEIGTIHAWCLRVLQQHAFDSGSLFQQRLRTDMDTLRLQVVRDVWRQWFYGQPANFLACISQFWATPDHLDRQLKGLIETPQAQLCHGASSASGGSWPAVRERHAPALAQRAKEAQTLWQAWQAAGAEVIELLLSARAQKQINGGVFRENSINKLSDEMRAWRGQGEFNHDWKIYDYFAPLLDGGERNKLEDKTTKGKITPRHPLIDQIRAFLADQPAQLKASDELKVDLLAALREEVSHQLDQRMRQQAELSFNDVLTRLHDALELPQGEAFAATLRQRFPVALIDEFQDTDPVQFGIFQRIYGAALAQAGAQERAQESLQSDLALILIGDPKQAIYSFRGADLPTYFAAREQASLPIHTLATNFRTDATVINGVNALYAQASRRAGGAFAQAGDHELVYIEANAHQQQARLKVRETTQDAWKDSQGVQLEYLASENDTYSSGVARDMLARAAANRIAEWLSASDAGLMAITTADGHRPICPGDIAILVRKGMEAKAMRKALASVDVPCVYGSDRDSVFDSDEAAAVQCWLDALANPSDERRLRLALATAPLGLSWQALLARREDEALWEQDIERVQRIAALWRSHGVLAALRRWLFEYQVPARLLHPECANGERALSNILHLAELLQQAADALHGEQAVIRYLAEHRSQQGGAAGDEALVRLESDELRVRIVTVHQAKGLEYPLVCLPFTAMPSVAPRGAATRYHKNGQLIIDLAPDKDSEALARHEQLAEELRLFYVAVTRPKHLLWMALAPVAHGKSQNIADNTAWQWLLSGHEALQADVLAQGVAELAGLNSITVAESLALATRWQPPAEDRLLLPAREFVQLKQPFWQIASYSRLRFHAATQTIDEANYLDEPEVSKDALVPSPAALQKMPRGPEVGTFWHSLLELAAEQHFASSAENLEILDDSLARQCLAHGWQHAETQWQHDIRRWLSVPMHTLSPSLDARSQAVARLLATIGLAQLERFVVEMEFWFTSQNVSTERLDTLVCAHTLSARARPQAESNHIHGLFKGFIDLVFVHEGRYFVADYKSNYLGDEPDNYLPERLAADIAKHRYDMQYSLYLLALHRHLRARLANYDPEQHLGGAVYIYLRGWDGNGRGVHIERPPMVLIEALDRLFAGAESPPHRQPSLAQGVAP
ncbi:MAG: exodeoxyribonuclease V subunit beta [Paraperlucidibaca sp.]